MPPTTHLQQCIIAKWKVANSFYDLFYYLASFVSEQPAHVSWDDIHILLVVSLCLDNGEFLYLLRDICVCIRRS